MAEVQEIPELPYGGEFISFIDLDEEEGRRLSEELFTGKLLEWAALRNARLGDYIKPKVIYIEPIEDQSHKVAWVEHYGLNPARGENFHNHHVVCECVLCKNFNDGRGGIDTSLCDIMDHALDARARMVGAEFLPAITARQNYEAVNFMTGLPEAAREFDLESLTLSAIEHVLHSDSVHPEAWYGNAVSGTLPVEQVGRIIDEPLPVALRIAEMLSRIGKADFDGQGLRLALSCSDI